MNSCAVAILAAAYGVETDAETPRKTTPSADGTDMMLRIANGELRSRIRFAAAAHDWSVAKEIVSTLCTHYALPSEQPPVEAVSAA